MQQSANNNIKLIPIWRCPIIIFLRQLSQRYLMFWPSDNFFHFPPPQQDRINNLKMERKTVKDQVTQAANELKKIEDLVKGLSNNKTVRGN